MEKWKYRGDQISIYRCVTLSGTGEKCLAGKLGEIWEVGTLGLYRGYFVTPGGQEKIITFGSKYLPKAVLRLKVPSNPEEQAVYANDPNSREFL